MAVRKKTRLEWTDIKASPSNSLPRDGWVRLIANYVPEAEEARRVGIDSLTGEKLFELDGKLARDIPMFRALGAQLYVSDIFLGALIRGEVTGMSAAVLVPHFAPNKVNGRAFYRVTIQGELGVFTSPRRRSHVKWRKKMWNAFQTF